MHNFIHSHAPGRYGYPAFSTGYPCVFRRVPHILIHSFELSRLIRWYSPGFSTASLLQHAMWIIRAYHLALIQYLSSCFPAELHRLLHIFIHKTRIAE
jgi:hypothetical protein